MKKAKDLRFLIVEDNKVCQMVMLKKFDILNLRVDVADSGENALCTLNLFPHYDLILMDYNLPGMDGPEVSKIIRNKEKNARQPTVIIATTSTESDSIKRECLESGMNDFINKDFTCDQLESIINKWVHAI